MVLVPDSRGMAALSGVEGVRPVRYKPGDPLPSEAEHAQVLVPGIGSTVEPAELLAALPKLEYVQLLTAGADHWVGRLPDDVLLSTCRGAHGGSTAEWVVASLLAIYRDLPTFIDDQRRGCWQPHGTDTLWGKRVLVIGAGDLGRQLARRLEPFDTAVTLVGRSARDGVRGQDEIPELLGEHDATVLVLPLTAATTRLVDREFLARMPDGAVLVNAARGPMVDTDALVAELERGRLRAALDVTDPEPLPAGHPLWSAPNLLLTPHVGGNTRGYADRAWRVAAEEIARFAAGESPRNLVRGEY